MTQPNRFRFLLTLCALAALLLAPAAMAQPDECKGKKVKVVQVMIDAENVISVDKESVTIERQGRVCWEIEGLAEGETLTMSGKEASDDQFPEKSVSLPRMFMNSGIASKDGTFHYDLILTKGKDVLYTLDPQVIIDPPGGY